MAVDYSELEQNIVTAITALAQRAAEEEIADYAAGYASAVLSLSEALAWYRAPAQPHGGSISVNSGG